LNGLECSRLSRNDAVGFELEMQDPLWGTPCKHVVWAILAHPSVSESNCIAVGFQQHKVLIIRNLRIKALNRSAEAYVNLQANSAWASQRAGSSLKGQMGRVESQR
jgi:hypothetical protein